VKAAKQIHVVLDNLSVHKTKDVERFSKIIRGCSSTLRPHIRHGSTKWSYGSPTFSAM